MRLLAAVLASVLCTALVSAQEASRPAGPVSAADAAKAATAPATIPAMVAAEEPASRAPPGLFSKNPLPQVDFQTGPLLWRMLAYVLVIAVLGGAGMLLARRLGPRLRTGGGRNISILETAYLGPRKTLQLVQVGSRRYLLACGRDEVAALTDVTGAFEGQASFAAAVAEARKKS